MVSREQTQNEEANYFARCLLMPEKMVKEYMNSHDVCLMDSFAMSEMARKFGVDQCILAYRLAELGYK